MKTTFKDYLNENNDEYSQDFFKSLDNHFTQSIEEPELWINAIDIATKNGKIKSTFKIVRGIYNKLFIKKPEPKKSNPKYDYYKKRFDQISWAGKESRKKFFKDLLDKLKEKGDLTQNQWDWLIKLKGHSII